MTYNNIKVDVTNKDSTYIATIKEFDLTGEGISYMQAIINLRKELKKYIVQSRAKDRFPLKLQKSYKLKIKII